MLPGSWLVANTDIMSTLWDDILQYYGHLEGLLFC
jgi:hypothetical protein